MKLVLRERKRIIALVLAILMVFTSMPIPAMAENLQEVSKEELIEEILEQAHSGEETPTEEGEEVEETTEEPTEEAEAPEELNSEEATAEEENSVELFDEKDSTEEGKFKVSLRWGGTSNPEYKWHATKSEKRVIKLTFYYQNEVTPEAYAPGELVVTIPGIGKLNRASTKKATDIAADVYGSAEQKRDWSYKYDAKTDTYTFYNNHEIEQGATFNGSFEMLWEFESRESINDYEQKLQATLKAGNQSVITPELSLNFTSVKDTFYLEKTIQGVSSADGLSKYIEKDKKVSDYGWVIYTLRYNVKELNARGLKNRYLIDTFPEGVVVATDSNVIKNEDGTTTYKISESSVLDNRLQEYSIIVGYPEEYIGKTIENTAYIFGTYKDEEEEVELAQSTVSAKIERLDLDDYVRGVLVTISKYMNPDYVYKKDLENDINFSANLYATTTSYIDAAEEYTIALTDDILQIYTPSSVDGTKEAAYHTLDDDEYKFTSVTIPGKNSFKNANGYTLSDGDYKVKIYALYAEDIETRGLEEYTLVHEGKWENNDTTKNLEKDAVAIRVEVSGLKESIQSFYVKVSGKINVSENVANNIYENPLYIFNFNFVQLYKKDGTEFDKYEIKKEDYAQEDIYDRDLAIYGEGLYRKYDTIEIREKYETKGYYYAIADIENFAVDEKVEYFITKLNHYAQVYNTNAKEISKIEVHGVVAKEELKTTINSLKFICKGLKFKNNLSNDTDMQDYLLERAEIEKTGTEISVVFDFSDNPIVSTNFNIGFTVDAKLNYEKYSEATNPNYGIITYAYVEHENLNPQSIETHKEKTMAVGRDSASILLALASHQQLIKMVQTQYTDDFVQEAAVAPMNTEYTYRLKLRNGYNTLVNTEIIDILEHSELTVVDGENPYPTSEWYGTFKNVDTTQIEKKGLGAKVYYANTLTPAMDSWVLMEKNEDGIWTTENEVKAIKVEIEGEITENSIIYADVNMQAPNDETLEDKKVYNSYTINCDAIDLYSGMQSSYMRNMPSNNVDVRLVKKEYNVEITKKDAVSGAKLQGAMFAVYDEVGNKIASDITGILGKITLKGLKDGEYILKEERAPLGYEVANNYRLIIEDGKYILKERYIDYEDTSINLIFTPSESYGWIQNEDGTWQSDNYHVNYSTATMTSNEFILTKTGTINFDWSVSCGSYYNYLYYRIKDLDTNTVVDGTGDLTRIEGTSYGTTYESLIFNHVEKELEPGRYVIEFVYRKSYDTNSGLDRGFVKNVKINTAVPVEKEREGIEGTPNIEGEIPTINLDIEDPRAKGSITVYKKDEYLDSNKQDIPLSDIQFELLDAEGNIIAEGITDINGKIMFEDLDWGLVYILKEKQAKTGYELAQINTYLSKLDKDKIVTIENIRKEGTAILTKQDEVDGTKLEGALYGIYAKNNIYDKEGNLIHEPDTLIKEVTTNAQGQAIFQELIWGDYYIKEIETVYGYELSDVKHEFTINAATIENAILKTENEERSKANLQLIKIDEKGNFLPGVEFGLYTEAGEEVKLDNLEKSEKMAHTTDKNGQLNIQGIEWGNYYIQEIKAPEGYELSNTKYLFTVDRETFKEGKNTIAIVENEETGEEISIIRNNRKKGRVTLTKYACDAEGNETETVLEGAVYEIYSSEGKLIGEYTTDENGQIVVENLDWDSYYFLEKTAPTGYSISDKKISFVVNSKNASFEQELTAYNKQESGEIKINKTIPADTIYSAHGESTFIFKIVGKDENNEEKVTLYRTIPFTEKDKENKDENGNLTKTITISDIEPYKYEITEEENYRYETGDIIPVKNAEVNENIGIINLIQATENKGEISFVNQKTSNSLLADNGLITNIIQAEYQVIAVEVKPKEERYDITTTLYLTADDFEYTLMYTGGQVIEGKGEFENVTINGKTTYKEDTPGDYIVNVQITHEGKIYEVEVPIKWVINNDYFKYRVIDENEKTIEIIGRNVETPILYIPREYNGYNVVRVGFGFGVEPNEGMYSNVEHVKIAEGITSIGYNVFYNNYNLKSIELPNSITSIERYAFIGCSNLDSIDLSNTQLTSIEEGVFSACSSLTSIELPNSVTSIGNNAFQNCRNVTSVDISNTAVTSIGDSAFYNCSSLTNIELPDSFKSMGKSTFSMCSNLERIGLNGTGTTINIGNNAFLGCSKLTTINYYGAETQFSKMPTSLSGKKVSYVWPFETVVLNEEEKTMAIIGLKEEYAYKKEVIIPNEYNGYKIIQIGNGSKELTNCENMRKIVIYGNLQNITDNAFNNCKKLAIIDCYGTPEEFEAITVGNNNEYFINAKVVNKYFTYKVLNETNKEIEITGINNTVESPQKLKIPNQYEGYKVTQLTNGSFTNIKNVKTIEIEEGIEKIGSSAFYNCANLENIKLPNSLISIEQNAFQMCEKLISIDLSNTKVTNIGNYTFQNCKNLTSIDLPQSLTSIGAGAFQYCYSLTSIDIPDSVTSIGYDAFSGCSSLKSINIPDSVTSIGNFPFGGCSSLTSIDVSENHRYYSNLDGILYNKDKSILIRCPEGKDDITVIPNSVTSIGDSAFRECSKLASIDLSDTKVTNIGNYTFENCKNLTSIDLPEGVTSIGGYAFKGCSSLTSIDIPDSVTSIGSNAFDGCSGLTSIDIPDSVTSIGYSAFKGCSSLTSIDIPDSVTSIGSNAFDGCSGLTSIDIPDSVTSIGYSAFYNCNNLKTINYYGTEEQFKAISVSSNNTYFTNATVNYILPFEYIVLDENAKTIAITGIAGNYTTKEHISIPSIFNGYNIVQIGDGTSSLSNMENIRVIEIEDGITTIANGVFSGSTNLEYIGLHSSITNIGANAFSECNSLKEIYYFGTQEQFNTIEIADGNINVPVNCCIQLAYKVLNGKEKTIAITGVESKFADTETLYIPDEYYGYRVVQVGGMGTNSLNRLANISNVKTVEIEEGIETIRDYAFHNYTNIENVNLPDSVISIGVSAFRGCKLASIDLSNSGVTSIGGYAFYGCSSLTSIDIPDGVTSIGGYAFYNCNNLKTINYYGTEEQFKAITIGTSNAPFKSATVNYITE